ncbi:hypothetical protein [Brevibacillus daliensis]|uniref:hypothetical protein n=1 Tax=Brevibacillus daliensis TaxID=2892995 RepID=UPI001E3D794E|nr:hypothetical protein [Brevibacillus daliensis]
MLFAISNGLLAGLMLGVVLAIGDGVFQSNTLQILLNISYVPGFEHAPAILEFFIHLVISVLVTFLFIFFYPRKKKNRIFSYAVGWNILFFLLYFIFTSLSGISYSFIGILVWMVGHVIFTLFLVNQIEKKR